MEGSGMKIINGQKIQQYLLHMDTTDKTLVKEVKKVLRKPFYAMKRGASINLRANRSIRTGNLLRSLSVSTRSRRGWFSVAFGGRTGARKKGSHFHLVNTGTKLRKTKKGYNRGAVGKGTYEGRNTSFRIGFADNAINAVKPRVVDNLVEGLDRVFENVSRKYKT